MRMCTHGRQTMVTETSETTNFWARFFYNMFLRILNSNPIQQYNIFLLANFVSGGLKKPKILPPL